MLELDHCCFVVVIRVIEGRSTYYVDNKGFIYRHVLDRVRILTVVLQCIITMCVV